MISFKQFILEVETYRDASEVAETIKHECAPFLREIDFFDGGDQFVNALWRGMNMREPVYMLPGQRFREPKDSPQGLHEILDQHMENQFGFPYRSKGLFTSTARKQAKDYGTKVFMIFPIGEFEYAYAPDIRDAYIAFDNGRSPELLEEILGDMDKMYADYTINGENDGTLSREKWFPLVYEWLERRTPYTNAGLARFVRENNHYDGYEVMLNTSMFYAVRASEVDDLDHFVAQLKS